MHDADDRDASVEVSPEEAELADDGVGGGDGGGPVRAADFWRQRLVRGRIGAEKNAILPIAANVVVFLQRHLDWAGVVAYDEFAEAVVSTRSPPWDALDGGGKRAPGVWTDEDTTRLVNWFARREKFVVGALTVEQALAVVAAERAYHPVRAYLRGLRWDGVCRLEVLPHLLTCESTPYSRGVLRRWMISAVARAMSPGCKVDCVLVLESPEQGRKKTTFFQSLVPVSAWYSDSAIDLGNKDSYQNLRSTWIYGFDELDSLRGRDLTRTKSFLSATADRYRASFGRRAREWPRQNVFCGTTNEERYLVDATGNRRFWPLRIRGEVDIAAVVEERDQLWAEAAAAYGNGEKWHVDTPEFRALCEEAQAERMVEDPWSAAVGQWIAQNAAGRAIDAAEILGALGIEIASQTVTESMRLARVLRGLGYARDAHQTATRRGRVRLYRPAAHGT
jgi:putative DNA primase/helicase